MDTTIHEKLKKLASCRTVEDRVKYLRSIGDFTLKTILQVNFSKNIVFELPEGSSDSWFSDEKTHELSKVIHILKEFTPSAKGYDQPTKIINFIKLVGSQGPDGKVLVWMKDKELSKHYRNLSRTTVEQAFPGLIQK